jgi:hypothetical protein
MFSQVFAGGGLGLLVGLLLGLSSSPTVALVVGALATAMTTLLGFVKADGGTTGISLKSSAVRLGSFGFACAVAVLLGLLMRTHEWASPSVDQQINALVKAGYSPDEARQWVEYRSLGTILNPAARGTSGAESRSPASNTSDLAASHSAALGSSVLFSGGDSGDCQYFDTSQYKNAQEQLHSLQLLGGVYARYAQKIGSLDDKKQKAALEGLQLIYCPQ